MLIRAVSAIEDSIASVVGVDALVTTGALEFTSCTVIG